MSSFKLKKQRPIGTQAFRIQTAFKTRTQESKHRAIARALPTQAHLDAFLSKLEEAARPMAMELLRPHLSFALPPVAEPEFYPVESLVLPLPPACSVGRADDVGGPHERAIQSAAAYEPGLTTEVPPGGGPYSREVEAYLNRRNCWCTLCGRSADACKHVLLPGGAVEADAAAAFAEISSEDLYRIVRGDDPPVPANGADEAQETTPEATAWR